MQARQASTGTRGRGQDGAGTDVRIGARIFQAQGAPPAAQDKSRPPLGPQSATRRRPGLY